MIVLSEKNKVFIEQLAKNLSDAQKSRQGIPPLTEGNPTLSVEEAYNIQLVNVEKLLEEGKRIIGKKIGLTSVAMQEALGVDEPDYGHLLDHMAVSNGEQICQDQVMQPKVEAEIAFILKEDLQGPNVSTLDVLQATKYITPAIEVIDSRIIDWEITLPDTVADNASSGLYVLGEKLFNVTDYNLKQTGMALYKNGELCNTGVGAAALGDPAYCVAWLANKLAEFDISLKAGEVILSGALSTAVEIEPGDYIQARFANLGEISIRYSK